MIFTTYWFIVAVAIFLPCYFFAPNSFFRFCALIAFCIIFHCHFAGPAGVLPIMVLAAATFLAARSRVKLACQMAIVFCVTALLFYKYLHFLLSSLVTPVFPSLTSQLEQQSSLWLPTAPPLAISFFVFEFVHYLVEVSMGKKPIHNLFEFAQFSLFFPSLVAGPIKRYAQFLPSLQQGIRKVAPEDLLHGFYRVLGGFLKKSVIADNLTLYVTSTAGHFAALSMQERWQLVVCIALRIYFDFSGYTDMAIGFARMMGIRLPQNFNWPYVARNIKDFWQRWHISLSAWIRDYIYIPLGGNRNGSFRRLFNGMFAFALCGLWHGAAWNFLLWGLYHGLGLAVCSSYRKYLGPFGRGLGRLFDSLPVVSWAVTTAFVGLGWLLFFYPADQAWNMARLLFVSAV